MLVRWLGAFRKKGSLHDSLKFELSRPCVHEVAAEPLKKGQSTINHVRLGLVVKNSALVKTFRGDVWSELRDGKLVRTRKPVNTHAESWVNPIYVAIIVKDYSNMKGNIKGTLKYFSKLSGLPIINFKNLEEIGTE